MDSERPAEPGSPAPHCVVWHPRSMAPPPNLMAALDRRHVHIEFCTGPFAALAAVIDLDRQGHPSAPAPNGSPRGSLQGASHGVILVLVQPSALDQPVEVVRSAEAAAPRARCWCFDAAAPMPLRAIGSAELEAELSPAAPSVIVTPPFRREAMPPVVRHAAQVRPPLRLAGDGVLPAAASEPADDADPLAVQVRETGDSAAAQPPRSPLSREVLTQDELAMLLSEDNPESGHRPPGRAGESA